ncbi:4Fe4S ferredoxin [Blattamonas nauphoetae]|uniref:4Fe4S ferredoxin n=1 Tax=Blattamonas nauphoetae TaxID=2049346 RepID=A0ABQ9YBB1_9EUKA|nr:4Fe4S ferredoxin [Blattamonas nauphoetae]
MKVVILFFSNTGSTKAMALTFQKHLEGAGHTVSLQDGFLILKQYLAAGEKEVTPLLSNYHNDLKEADIVGIGSYVSGLTLAGGAAKLMTEEATPTSYFANMKYYFAFSSYGNIQGWAVQYLATYLKHKNENAKFLGLVSQHDPENFIPLQPARGRIDEIPAAELKKVDDFGKDLISRLNGAPLPPLHSIVTRTVQSATAKPISVIGPIKLDADKCIACYKCVTICPYNALSKPEEGSTLKIPTWDKSSCYGCGRCFNFCPARAIEFPRFRSQEREQYYWGKSDPKLITQPMSRTVSCDTPQVMLILKPLELLVLVFSYLFHPYTNVSTS